MACDCLRERGEREDGGGEVGEGGEVGWVVVWRRSRNVGMEDGEEGRAWGEETK